jgi:outer membrane lipoprotein SlyB
VGAIIGAMAGGGKGAAIGAVIGGTGGVILSQGHEQLELTRGTEVTLTVVSSYRGR